MPDPEQLPVQFVKILPFYCKPEFVILLLAVFVQLLWAWFRRRAVELPQGNNGVFDLENAIADWRQQMSRSGVECSEVLDELESHLREDIQRLVKSGAAVSDAFEAARKGIGDGSVLGKEFARATVLAGFISAIGIALKVSGWWFILMGLHFLLSEARLDFTFWGAFVLFGVCLLRLRVQRINAKATFGNEFIAAPRAEGFARARAIGINILGWWFILSALDSLSVIVRILLLDDPRMWSSWGLWSKTGTWNIIRLWTELAFSYWQIYLSVAALLLIGIGLLRRRKAWQIAALFWCGLGCLTNVMAVILHPRQVVRWSNPMRYIFFGVVVPSSVAHAVWVVSLAMLVFGVCLLARRNFQSLPPKPAA